MILKSVLLSLLAVPSIWLSAAWAKPPKLSCAYPNGDRTNASELAASIRRNRGACALPWRALQRIAQDADGRQKVEEAYNELERRYPESSVSVRARRADLAAARGQPEMMLKIADENISAHPDDKSLPNMSCFVRGRYGFDVQNAMRFCDAAVDADGRKPWALVNRGRVALATGQFVKALRDFEEALANPSFRDHPMIVDAVYGRGFARLRLGDMNGQRDIKAALAVRQSVADDFADAGLRP